MKRLMLGILLSLALTGCSDNDAAKDKAGSKPGDISAGKALAEKECRGCHGLDGKGVAPGIPNLAAQWDSYLLLSLSEYRDGRRSHAALRAIAGHMSDAEMRNVSAFYASLPPIAAASAKDAAIFSPYDNGKKVAAACTQCHGSDGNSTTAGTPSLAGQQPRYFVAAVHEYLIGARETSPMHALVRDMSKLDLESVALYFASQTPAQRPASPFGDAKAGEAQTALCGGCHGSQGVSTDAATPSLAGQDPRYLVNAIKAYRKTRKHEVMQRAVAAASDKDIDDIAAFYAVQKSEPAENGQALIHDLTEKCNRCHATAAASATVVVPKINGQDKDYLIMALRAYRDERRASTTMHKMSLPYSDSVIESISSFYASQPAK
jgi:cytochrome c553